MMTFSGPSGVQTYRALAIRKGLLFYARTGMKPNTAWTPTAMLKAASQITGKQFRRGQYELAANELAYWLEDHGDNR